MNDEAASRLSLVVESTLQMDIPAACCNAAVHGKRMKYCSVLKQNLSVPEYAYVNQTFELEPSHLRFRAIRIAYLHQPDCQTLAAIPVRFSKKLVALRSVGVILSR